MNLTNLYSNIIDTHTKKSFPCYNMVFINVLCEDLKRYYSYRLVVWWFWMLHTYYITVSIFIYPYVFEWLLKLWFEYVLFCGIIVNSILLFLFFTAADERVKSVNALYTYVNIFLNIENSAFDHIHVVK